jgi:hypothetical protein
MAAPDRASHEACFASLDASDMPYGVSYHPAGVTLNEHWKETHELAARAGSDLVLVLEDDCLVNRHILWNIRTWLWTKHRNFSAGWVYNPGHHASFDSWYDGPPKWFGTVGVVYPTKLLPRLIELAWKEIVKGQARDTAMAEAACKLGRIRIHYPSLVEHMDQFDSLVGNPRSQSMRTSRGSFDAGWKRPERHEHGVVDDYGRVVENPL